MSFSPEMREAGLSSCFGRLDEKESRYVALLTSMHGVDCDVSLGVTSKVHFLLVSTLNSAFPDHDFASLPPDQFTREPSSGQVLGHLSGNLFGTSGAGETSSVCPQ